MAFFGKGEQKATKTAAETTKKNSLTTILHGAGDSEAEITIKSDQSLKSEKITKTAIKKILDTSKWGAGKYTVTCVYSGEETGEETHEVDVTEKDGNLEITIVQDEAETTMLEEEVSSSSEPSVTEDKDENASKEEELINAEVESTEELDSDADTSQEEEKLIQEQAQKEQEEKERKEREAEEAAEEERLEAERAEAERIEAERQVAERIAKQQEEARKRAREDGAGLASVVVPRSSDAITASVEVLSERMLKLAAEEEEFIIPLQEKVDQMSLKDYAGMKKKMFESESYIQEKAEKYIKCNTELNSITDLEMEDPSQAALLLLSFENLKHVMSNVRVLQAVFPNMDERTIRTMNPKSFGLTGKWDDAYDGEIL